MSIAVATGSLAGWGVTGTASGATVPTTIVSLTFDDGNADQLAAEQVMKAHGLVGTFFVTTELGRHSQLPDATGPADHRRGRE